MRDRTLTREQGIEVLVNAASCDGNGLGPALDYTEALPAFIAVGITQAEVDAACQRLGSITQSWLYMGQQDLDRIAKREAFDA
jgi:hypothetical protein